MATSKKSTQDAIEVFRRYAEKTYAYVETNVAPHLVISDDDDFAFISVAFLHKLLVHARSISLLCSEGLVSDAGIVARSMLEGLIYLAWMGKDKPRRAAKYRHFAAVEDFRQIREMDRRGEPVPAEVRAQVANHLKSLDRRFLNRRALQGSLPSTHDPYQSGWNYDDTGARIEIRTMAEEIGDAALKELYDDLSKWSHWTIRGIGRNLRRSPGFVHLSTGDEYDAIRALAAAGIALTGVGIAVDSHLKGKHSEILDALRTELVTELRKISK